MEKLKVAEKGTQKKKKILKKKESYLSGNLLSRICKTVNQVWTHVVIQLHYHSVIVIISGLRQKDLTATIKGVLRGHSNNT
jgi:hypothetical protein